MAGSAGQKNQWNRNFKGARYWNCFTLHRARFFFAFKQGGQAYYAKSDFSLFILI